MPQRTVETLFCERFQCSAEEFPERAFRNCLYIRARPIRPFLDRVLPDYFALDFEFIRQLGSSANLAEVRAAARDFEDANRWPRTFLRTWLKVRVSGQKAIRLGRELLDSQPKEGI